MKEFNPIATIKKYKVWIIMLSLLAGAVCFFALNSRQSYTATAIMEYTNKEAVDGKAPDGSTIDPTEVYSAEVMKEVFARMDMSYEDYNLDKFRSKVVVKEIMTDEEEAVQEALNEKGETMTTVPTKYYVSITLDKGDAADPRTFARQMLENMLDVYLSVYGENHVSGSIVVNDIVTLEESSFDYIEAVEAIDEDVSGTVTSLENTINRGDDFRASANGYSFGDLYREFRLIEDRQIPNLYAYILNNKLTKNSDILIAKYRQRIENYNIENEDSLRKIGDIKQIIAAYVEMMRQSGNTDITYEYILDELYDTYFKDVTTGSTEKDALWINPDETIEYEVLLKEFISNRTEYEYALIEIAYCEYVIENYGGAVAAPAEDAEAAEDSEEAEAGTVTGEPIAPIIGITGDAAGAEAMIGDLMTELDDLYAKLAVVKAEYNEFSGAENIGLISNIVVTADVQVLLYTLILMIACLMLISALVIFVDRVSDILNFHLYTDSKFLVGNRSACDRYLAQHERSVLPGDTVCIAVKVTDLREKNLEYGREACDGMMRKLAELLTKVFPAEQDCFVALNGQGQFVVFAEGFREGQAKACMRYLENEATAFNMEGACPIAYSFGIAEAEHEEIYQLRSLLVCAVNKANETVAANR